MQLKNLFVHINTKEIDVAAAKASELKTLLEQVDELMQKIGMTGKTVESEVQSK